MGVPQDTGEQARVTRMPAMAALDPVALQQRLSLVEQGRGEQRNMLAGIGCAIMGDLPQIDAVLKDGVKRAAGER